jgi:hypothetical protein
MYAITRKNRMIISCFVVITASQFIIGLCMVAYAAMNGCESVTKCCPQFLSTSISSGTDPTNPTSDLYDLRLQRTAAYGNRIYHHVSRIRYGTSLALHPGDIHSDHPADLLAFSVIIYLVVQSNVNNVPISRLFKTIVQDATYYFLVIFTSHFMLVMFLAFADVRISS